MRGFKSRLTHLKNKVNEIIPEGQDILGFSGISKELILESIGETYQVLDLLTDYENKFEGILLQRKLADCIDKATSYLKEKFKHQSVDDFNRFLYKIAEMHYAAKETYILFTKEPIRLDSALANAKETLAELENQNSQIQPIVENLSKSFSETSSSIESLNKNNNESATKLAEIKGILTTSLNLKKKAEAAANSISKSEQEIQAIN